MLLLKGVDSVDIMRERPKHIRKYLKGSRAQKTRQATLQVLYVLLEDQGILLQ